ncbi:hypothetical protein [Kribbella sp. NBC_00889]|uniref:hypothetical protein n=1 Tax=Kribbella sp. NBC_00889 TaxID=2975974 RepID=UPI00387096F1|nr:hypothetical protein OG817_22090 [Kribbella sp. NBC_00889]
MTALGRYCLAVCYCGQCPQWQAAALSAAERARLLDYLAHPPRKQTPSWYRDPLGRGQLSQAAH